MNTKSYLKRMKRLIVMSFLVIYATSNWAIPGHAPDFVSDGVYYYITSEENATVAVTYKFNATVIKHYSYSGEVTVPTTVENGGKTYTVTAIGDGAFFYCNVTAVHLPNTITCIGEGAFNGCSSLVTLNMPTDLTTIKQWAFAYTKVESIILPNGITELPDYTFRYASGLKEIILPPTLKILGMEVFWGTKLEHIMLPEGLEIIKNCAFRECPIESVVIPSTVTKIGAGTFYDCKQLHHAFFQHPGKLQLIGNYAFYNSGIMNMFIPNTVTEIGTYAFCQCSNLETLEFEEESQLQSIGEYAFSGCTSLIGNLSVPGNVTSIGTFAFYGCKVDSLFLSEGLIEIPENLCSENQNLMYAYVPSTVTKIRKNAFSGCSNLTLDLRLAEYNVEAGAFYEVPNIKISSQDEWVRFLAKSHSPFYSTQWNFSGLFPHVYLNDELLTDIIVPEDVTSLCTECFLRNSDLQSITMSSVKTIGKDAFNNCTALQTVDLGTQVDSIGMQAFYECQNLSSINLEDTKLRTIEEKAFYFYPSASQNCLKSIVFPNTLKVIKKSAFAYRTALESVIFGDSIKEIYDDAFKSCTKISYVDIGDLANWCEASFYGYVEGGMINSNPISYVGRVIVDGVQLDALNIPTRVTRIGNCAFSGCKHFDKVNIPNAVKSIGGYAFYGCSDLENVTFGKRSNLETIGWSAFEGTSIQSINIPASVSTLGGRAFANCKTLESMTIPDNLKELATRVFYNCKNLTQVNLHDSFQKIADYTFENCTSLKTMYLPPSMQSIGYGAFLNDSGLMFHIDDLSAWCKISFSESWCTGGHSLYLNDELVTDLVIPADVDTINAYAFYKNTKIETITMPEGLKAVGASCFYGNTYVTNIYVPTSLQRVGSNAFGGLYRSAARNINVYINDLEQYIRCRMSQEVYSVSSYIAGKCHTYLYLNGHLVTDLVIPECFKALGVDFQGYSFTTVTLPSGLESIQWNAFQYCSKMKYIYSRAKYAPLIDINESSRGIYPKSKTLEAVYVPAGRVNNYKSNWPANASIIKEAPENINPTGSLSITSLTDSVNAHNYVYDDVVPYLNLTEATLDETVTAESLQDIADKGTIIFLPDGTQGIEGTNIVANGSTQKLILRDSTDFVAPYDFVAEELEYQRNFTASNTEATTLCLPYSLSELPQGMKAYALKGQDTDGNAVFEEVETVEANMPYVVTTTKNINSLQGENVVVKATPTVMPDAGCDEFEFRGALTKVSHDDAAYEEAYVLSNGKQWQSVYDASEDVYVPAGRAYLVPMDIAPISFGTVLQTTSPNVYAIGDVNGDNVIDALDASLILQYVAHKFGDENTDFIKAAADTNNDNVIDALDASLVLQHAAKKIDLNEINTTE